MNKESTFNTFFNPSEQLTVTAVEEQVTAGEPDYPVHPAPPGGFQHLISDPKNSTVLKVWQLSVQQPRGNPVTSCGTPQE